LSCWHQFTDAKIEYKIARVYFKTALERFLNLG